MNFSAALAASSGVRRLSLLASASSRIWGARNIPGPKSGRRSAARPRRRRGPKPGGGPNRRLIAARAPRASSEPFLSLSASRTNFSAALAASSGESRPSLSASAASRIVARGTFRGRNRPAVHQGLPAVPGLLRIRVEDRDENDECRHGDRERGEAFSDHDASPKEGCEATRLACEPVVE